MENGTIVTELARHLHARADDAVPYFEPLARCASERDEAAFGLLVRRYGGLVLGVAARRLADRAAADGKSITMGAANGSIKLYETASWTVRADFRGGQGG